MTISLTERAAEEVKRVRNEQGLKDDVFLRIGVRQGGCGGPDYMLMFDEKADDERDEQLESHGVKLVVDRQSAVMLAGTTIDWYEDANARGFKFDNPNAGPPLGPGGSFEV